MPETVGTVARRPCILQARFPVSLDVEENIVFLCSLFVRCSSANHTIENVDSLTTAAMDNRIDM